MTKAFIAGAFGAALLPAIALAQVAPPSQAEKNLVAVFQAKGANDVLIGTAVQAFMEEKEARIRALEAQVSDLQKQIPKASEPPK